MYDWRAMGLVARCNTPKMIVPVRNLNSDMTGMANTVTHDPDIDREIDEKRGRKLDSLVGKKMRISEMPVGARFAIGKSKVLKIRHAHYLIGDQTKETMMTENASYEVISDPVVEVGDEVRCEKTSNVHVRDAPDQVGKSGTVVSIRSIGVDIIGMNWIWPTKDVTIVRKGSIQP